MSHISASIRQARNSDCAAIMDCVQAAYAVYIERIGKKPTPMLANYPALIAEGVVYVLVEQEDVRGALVIMRQDESLFIENIAVTPAFQGQGLGRALMAFAEEQARREHLSEIRLYTNELMTENLRLYHHLGFEEVARASQDGYRRVFLRKHLT
jgi:ribosomal protein S18 acetylase RimI-like enzyme